MGRSIFFAIFMFLSIAGNSQKIGLTFTPPMTSNGAFLSHRVFGGASMAYGAEYKRLPDNGNGAFKLSMGVGFSNGIGTDFFAMANVSSGKMHEGYRTESMELGFVHSFSFNHRVLCMSFLDIMNAQLKIGVGIDISAPMNRSRKNRCR